MSTCCIGRKAPRPQVGLLSCVLLFNLWTAAPAQARGPAHSRRSEPHQQKHKPAGTPARFFADVRNVPYVSAGTAKQMLDIYKPKTAGKHPVIVFVHGGGWYGGDKGAAAVKGLGRSFADNGVVLVSVGYRLTRTDKYPAFMEDLAAGVKWVKGNIEKYGGDPNRVYLLGHSAGAHMVALLVTNPRFLNAQALNTKDIAGVIPLDTDCHDLTDMSAAGNDPFVKTAFGEDPAVRLDASPVKFVSEAADLPPFLIPERQDGNGYEWRDRLAEMLKVKGKAVETFQVYGKTHQGILDDLAKRGDPVRVKVDSFIRGK